MHAKASSRCDGGPRTVVDAREEDAEAVGDVQRVAGVDEEGGDTGGERVDELRDDEDGLGLERLVVEQLVHLQHAPPAAQRGRGGWMAIDAGSSGYHAPSAPPHLPVAPHPTE